MDYYGVLRLTRDASKTQIDHAFNRLVKEAQYDSTIDEGEVRRAYRVLGDSKRKAAYDRGRQERTNRIHAAEKVRKRRTRQVTFRQKVAGLIILLVICSAFYFLRFGYVLKSFSPGDVLYSTTSNRLVGTIIAKENDHQFPTGARQNAYQIRLTDNSKIWWPEHDVQTHCYTP